MNDKKDITINTSAFSMTIHWNGPVVSTQLCILAGIILLRIFAGNHDVQVLCNVVLLIDVISMLGVLLWGSSVNSGSEEKGEEKAKTEDKAKLEKPATKEPAKEKEHVSSVQSDKTVKKRVPMPTQKGVQRVDTQKTEMEPEPLQNVPEPEQPAPEEDTKPVKPVEEMSDEDLNNLFNW